MKKIPSRQSTDEHPDSWTTPAVEDPEARAHDRRATPTRRASGSPRAPIIYFDAVGRDARLDAVLVLAN